jgi:hypothetical protein
MLKASGFADIQAILDTSIAGEDIGAHGAFWRDTTRDEFVERKVFGRQLLVVGASGESNLVKALRGEAPFGRDIGTPGANVRRMPAGMAAMAEEDIAAIAAWIDEGCPA